MESKVEVIRDELVKKYQNICDPDILSCTKKTYDLCEGTGPLECLQNYPTSEGCFTPGLKLSRDSGVRIPNIFDKTKLNDNTRKFICASALI